MPERIQRKRTKGFRLPEGAVYVGRGTKWGNPWRVSHILHRIEAVELYRHDFTTRNVVSGGEVRREVISELRGKDLACWCPLDQPCHADVLLEIANRGDL